ncbi:MAG: cation:proton antiporter [Candidatus Eisenbacteria bacterium]|nr:cation:proton antiporter [Candidatus Eisenbacteria bacterium]
MSHPLQILLLLSMMVLLAKLAGGLSNKLGQPAVFGEMLLGLILGPTFLNILSFSIFASHDPSQGNLGQLVNDLADIGIVLLMFVAGMETDLKQMKSVGLASVVSAAGGVILPMAGGILVSRAFGLSWRESVFIGTVLTATSVSISAQTLMELNALKSRVGSTIIGAAVLDDVMGIIVLSLVVGFSGGENVSIVGIVIRIILFFVLSILLGLKFLEKIVEKAIKIPASQVLLAVVLVVTFMYSWSAEYLGKVASISGAYIAGVLFARTRFREAIDHGIHPLTYSMFVPVFFLSIGLRADARHFGSSLLIFLAILLVAVAGKIAGCGAGALLGRMTRKEALGVGVGMISRGEVGLIVASYGLSHGIIVGDIFSTLIVVVLTTTMITPILLKRVIPRGGIEAEEPVFESVAHLEKEEREDRP